MPQKAPEHHHASKHQKGRDKVSRIPVKVVTQEKRLPKPRWIRAKAPTGPVFNRVKNLLREQQLHTVCEEASCPNIGECFSKGTATFMILGDKCTRRCPFCDVAHARPDPIDEAEPAQLADTVATLQLNYLVITSVDRDDLKDGGAGHFANCIQAIRQRSPNTSIEILVPDFRRRSETALGLLTASPPDVFNHNLETVRRLYKAVRPGADYEGSLQLLQAFAQLHPEVPTKSGLMLGVGETDEEIIEVMADLRAHSVTMLTIGQYLQPTQHHLPVLRYVEPAQFDRFAEIGKSMGFSNVASGPMVRSSYHADLQASGQPVSQPNLS